jgi:hypothetical protein
MNRFYRQGNSDDGQRKTGAGRPRAGVPIVSLESRMMPRAVSPADNRRRVEHGPLPGKWRDCPRQGL